MVPLDVTVVAALRVLAVPIAGHQRSTHRRRYHTGLAPDTQRIAVGFFDDGDQPAIAGQSAQGFRVEKRFSGACVKTRLMM